MTFDFAGTYDALNPGTRDHLFYVELADRLDVRRVLDLGCGTGVLARMLAREGREVVGIDPDPAMLAVAIANGDGITWVEGFSERAASNSTDLAVMSGHVAQEFVTEQQWMSALADLHRALRPGGVLAFESRNPSARAWQRWSRAGTLRTVDTPDGPVEFWHETISVELPLVTYDTITRPVRGTVGERHRNRLAFRTQEQLSVALRATGFVDVEWFGDWDRSHLSVDSPEIIVVTRA